MAASVSTNKPTLIVDNVEYTIRDHDCGHSPFLNEDAWQFKVGKKNAVLFLAPSMRDICYVFIGNMTKRGDASTIALYKMTSEVALNDRLEEIAAVCVGGVTANARSKSAERIAVTNSQYTVTAELENGNTGGKPHQVQFYP